MMTKEDRQRGLELQGYINSIRDMTLKEIAIKHLKKHHLPKFLAMLLVKFSYPLLVTKDCEIEKLEVQLTKAKELLKWALHSDPEHDEDFDQKWEEAEQFLKEIRGV